MRLAAQAKMGYYPTPPLVVSLITGILIRSGPGKIRIFDPCAGEGHALKELKDSLQCESYGIEPDTHRGKIARQNLAQCRNTGSPIKGLVKRKNTSPIEKHTIFFFYTFVVAGFGIALLITLFHTRYFCLWFAWSLTRISHSPRRRFL